MPGDAAQQRIARTELMQQSGASLLNTELRRAPFLCAAGGMICGITLAQWLAVPQWMVLCGGASVALLWPALKRRKASLFAYALLIFAAFLFLGIARSQLFTRFPANHINSIIKTRSLAQVQAVIAAVPNINDSGSYASSEIDIRRIECAGGNRKAKGKSLLGITIGEGERLPEKGDYVLIYGTFEPIEPPLNPGEFNFRTYYASRGIQNRLNARSGGIIVMNSSRSNPLDHYRDRVRRALSESNGLLAALVIGERSGLSDQQTQVFRRAGLMHLLSLSGMHIGILTAAIYGALTLCGLRPRAKAVAAALILLAYMLLIPPRSPALRAAICAWVLLAGIAAGRKTSALNLLALAACITLFIRPLELFSAGWQLSFMCVFGIAALASPITSALHLLTGFRLAEPAIEMSLAKRFLLRLLQATAVSLAVSLAATPLVLYHFSCLYSFGGLFTILLSPLLTLTLCLGFAAALPAAVLPCPQPILAIANYSANFFEACTTALSKIPGSEIAFGQVSVLSVPLFYAALLLLFYSVIRFGRLWRIAGLTLLAVSAILTALPRITTAIEKPLRLTVLYAGEGQCVVCEMPGGENVFFDCGSLNIPNLDSRVIEPYLRHRGINGRLTAIVSHDDSDHYSAAPALMDSGRIGRVYSPEPLAALPQAEQLPNALEYGGCVVRFLRNEIGRTDNDRSAVAIIEYAGRTIALFADIEKESQKLIAGEISLEELDIDAAVLPHHGILRTLDESFVEAVSPQVCIASCSPRQISRGVYDSEEREVLRTAEAGAIRIEINNRGEITIEPFNGNPVHLHGAPRLRSPLKHY